MSNARAEVMHSSSENEITYTFWSHNKPSIPIEPPQRALAEDVSLTTFYSVFGSLRTVHAPDLSRILGFSGGNGNVREGEGHGSGFSAPHTPLCASLPARSENE